MAPASAVTSALVAFLLLALVMLMSSSVHDSNFFPDEEDLGLHETAGRGKGGIISDDWDTEDAPIAPNRNTKSPIDAIPVQTTTVGDLQPTRTTSPPARPPTWAGTPTLPPRPPLPTIPPGNDNEMIKVTDWLSIRRKKWVELHKVFQCWAWNGSWVKQPKEAKVNYVWTPSEGCGLPFKRNNGRDFCKVLNGRKLALLGDSITMQQYSALHSFVGQRATYKRSSLAERAAAPVANAKTNNTDNDADGLAITRKPIEESVIALYNHSRVYTLCGRTDRCSYMLFMRTDRFLLDDDPHRNWTYFYFDGPWSKEMAGFPGIIVMNRGAHWAETDTVLPEIRKALTYLRKEAPKAMVFFRTTAPGHLGCQELKEPIAVPQPTEGLPNHWGYFWGQNAAVVDLINKEFPGVGVLDVSFGTGTRADGHRSERLDCLHYDKLEQYVFWNDLMTNVIRELEAAGGVPGGPPDDGPRVGCG